MQICSDSDQRHILGSFFLIFVFLFFCCALSTQAEETEEVTEEISEAESEVIEIDYEGLAIDLEEITERIPGVWSIYVKNLYTGDTISMNSQSMLSASLIKLFVMMSSYDHMDELTEHARQVYGLSKDEAQAMIDDLLYNMITISDNEAYNELVRLHSPDYSFSDGCVYVTDSIYNGGYTGTGIGSTLHPSGSEYETFGDGYNYTSPEDCGMLLEEIYEGTCISEDASREMLRLLLQQETTYKIPDGVPEGALVANKTGENEDVTHDAAIVFGKQTNYVLCVMVSDINQRVEEAADLITEISSCVYHYLN